MPSYVAIGEAGEAGSPAARYAQHVATTAAGGTPSGRWSMRSRRGGTAQGARVFLLRQNNNRGMVASGRFTTGEIFEAAHFADPRRTAHHAHVTWDTVLPIGNRNDYSGHINSRHINSTHTLAVLIPSKQMPDLLDLIDRHRVHCVFEVAAGSIARL